MLGTFFPKTIGQIYQLVENVRQHFEGKKYYSTLFIDVSSAFDLENLPLNTHDLLPSYLSVLSEKFHTKVKL